MERNLILSGSRAFFSGLNGFGDPDYDYTGFKSMGAKLTHIKKGRNSTFLWNKNLTKEEIRDHINNNLFASAICIFLIPDIAGKIGVDMEFLKTLEPLAARLDERHKYLGEILGYYISNGSLTLTDEQRLSAFETYKRGRGIE